MSQLEIVQVGLIRPVLDGLQQAHCNMPGLLKQVGLEKFNLDNSENYIPVPLVYQLFDIMHRKEGVSDVLEHFSELIDLASLSKIGEMVAYTPDVLTACKLGIQYNSNFISHEKMSLQIRGEESCLSSRMYDNHVPGREQLDYLSLAVTIKGLRIAAGEDWSPREIHLQSSIMPNFDNILPSGYDTRILLNQPASGVVFSTSLLSAPMKGAAGLKHSGLELSCDRIEELGLGSRIVQLLDSTHIEHAPSIDLLANMMNMSTRSLQRYIAMEGTSFRDIVNDWRFKSAIHLLHQPGVRIHEISEQLRYSNVPNFERAFRRWTGTSPQRYRNKLI